MLKTSDFIITGLLLTIIYKEVLGLSFEWIQIGKRADLKCPLKQMGDLQKCQWNRLDSNREINFNITFTPNRQRIKNSNYIYFANILSECGISIMNVSESDIAMWECQTETSDIDDNLQNDVIEMAKIRFYKAVIPTNPYIQNKKILENMIIGNDDDPKYNFSNNTMNLKCCSNNGEPKPSLSFFLGDKIIPQVNTIETLIPNTYCIEWNNITFLQNDDGKYVRCVQNHITYGKEESDVKLLDIFYGPKMIDGNINLFIIVSANPKPTLNGYIKETNKSINNIIKFKIKNTTSHINNWNITWNVKKTTTLLQLHKTVFIQITNPYGHLLIPLTSENFTSTTPSPINVTTNNNDIIPGMSESKFVTLMVIIIPIIILTLGIVFIIVAKWNGILFFKSNRSDYPVRFIANRNLASQH